MLRLSKDGTRRLANDTKPEKKDSTKPIIFLINKLLFAEPGINY